MSAVRDLIAAVNRLAAAIEASNAKPAPTPTVGRCMRLSPDIFGPEHRMSCTLPFGHLGAHTDGAGHWSRETDDEGRHPAQSMPMPRGYMCAAGCKHGIAVHREHGCDVDDCDCPAPFGRIVQPDVTYDASSITDVTP